ncbi:MAG TPA: hypothetical protein VMF30_03475, partial [Pirellulales bacterium]|nr:hypothetical protein [Pirellulales bacterium]
MQRAARRQYLDTELSARRLTPPAPASPSPPPSLKPSSVPQTSAPAPANDEDAHAADVDHATADPQPSELIALQDKIRRVLALYFPKHQNTRDNSNWEVMHEIIAYGVDARLFRDGPDGPKVNAIGWLCYNGGCKGEQMLYLDRGKLVARKGPGVQGHFGQLLAILAQSRLPIDYPMLVGGKKFTIRDLVEHEKSDCT